MKHKIFSSFVGIAEGKVRMVSVFYLLLTTYLALSLCTPNTVLGEEERYRPYGKLTAQMYLNKWSALNSRYVECKVLTCFIIARRARSAA